MPSPLPVITAPTNIFYHRSNGEFAYGVPPRAIVTYLSGTARMAMINLTIVASVPDDELPELSTSLVPSQS